MAGRKRPKRGRPAQNKKGPTGVDPSYAHYAKPVTLKPRLYVRNATLEHSLLRTGPVSKAPGGWGLRNPVPTRPGQRSAVAIANQGGRRWAEIGHLYDPANVPVTGPLARFARR